MRMQAGMFTGKAKRHAFGRDFGLMQAMVWGVFLFVASTFFALTSLPQQVDQKVVPSQQSQDFPNGPGRDTFLRVCSTCHSPTNVLANGQSREGWENTITKMAGFGASATDEEFSDILDYLAKNFPANSHLKVNINKATADQLQTGLGLTPKEAEGIVAYRQKNGDFKSIDDLKKIPEVDSAKLEAKKNLVTFQ